jgi:hypothetical protein
MKSGYINTVLSWPSPSGGLATRLLRGRVVHAVYQHDNWCRTLNGVRIPVIAPTRSDASRPPVPTDRDQCEGAVRCTC